METPNISHITAEDYEHVYEPAEDSFLLLDALEEEISFIKSLNPTICLEIGTGSGIVITALGMVLGNNSTYIATDINPKACTVAQNTGISNNVQLNVVNTSLVHGMTICNNIDILIFNPPYVVTLSEEIEGVKYESLKRAWAGGKKGREVMDHLFPDVSLILSKKGLFYLLLISENCPSEIQKIMLEEGYVMKIIKERKIRGEHLLVLRFHKTL